MIEMDTSKNVQKNITAGGDVTGGDKITNNYYSSEQNNPIVKKSSNPFENISKRHFDNPEVIGRDTEISEIHKRLQNQKLPVYLHAIGGLGKTSVVRSYCFHYQHEYDQIFWIDVTNKDCRILV